MADINEELRVLVTAEVDKAIKNLKSVDKQTDATEKMFKQLGGAIGVAFSVKAVVDFSKQCAEAYREHNAAVSILNSTLEATGATAWTTSLELQKMAGELQKTTNYTADSINSMQSVLLGFRNIKGDTFEDATKAILDMATVMKMDLSSAAQSIGKALDDPIHGMDSLKKQGFNFTASQKKVIQSLLDTGDAAGAQKIILDELNGTFGGAAEAAADSATQIKNAWEDVKRAVAEGFVDTIKAFSGEIEGNPIADYLEGTAEAFRQAGKEMRRMKDYTSFWDSLNADEKLEEARYQIKTYEKQVELSLDAIDKAWTKSQKKAFEGGLENHRKSLEHWKEVEQSLLDTQKQQQSIISAENERADAEAAINDIMLEISKNYEKLGKDDPTVQLKNYQKELDEIKKKRVELSKEVLDSDGKIIDTSEALAQLDYIEKKINEKIANLELNGKKSWKNWLSDILGVDKKLFNTGKEAGELYVNGLERAVTNSEGLSKALGEKLFSRTDIYDSQLEEIKSKIQEALTIDPSKITESFSLDELAKENTALGTLVEKYKELKKARGESAAADEIKTLEKTIADWGKKEDELYIATLRANGASAEQIQKVKDLKKEIKELSVEDEIKELEKAVASLGATETELYLTKLYENGATADQIQKARELKEIIENYKDPKAFDSIPEKLGYITEQWLNDMDLWDKKTNKVVGNVTQSLAELSFNAALSGFKELGQALGEGEDAADSMQRALETMASEILNQLPLLFMQAGLQLIAQGQWPLGLGLMAAGLGDAVIAGYVNGKINGAKNNALGGVYGDDSYSAFAKGGTFTNQVVAKPTYFRFAKGSGFGTGLMGEAGPEAIMPLTRGADGSLGVSASGIGGGDVQVNIPVTVYSDEPVEVHDTEDENGQRKIEILVGSMINQHIAGGKADRALKGRYGLRPQGV